MTAEYRDSTHAKQNAPRPVKRKILKKGYRSRARNALYTLATEFKRRHPQSTTADAWQHLVNVAAIGAHPVIIAHDPDAGTLTYRPDIGRFETREIRKDTFYRGFRRIAAS